MNLNWLQKLMATEEAVLPILLTNPNSTEQKIVGAVLVTETLFGTIFGKLPAVAPPAPNPPAQE